MNYYQPNKTLPKKARANTPTGQGSKEELIPIDGRQQVIDLLRAADPQFREQLLRQIAGRDPLLARELRARLGQ